MKSLMTRHMQAGAVALALALAAGTGASATGRSTVQERVPGQSGWMLEGTWRVEVTLRQCQTGEALGPPFRAMATFARGGTITTSDGGLSPAARGAGHGMWWPVDRFTFAAVTEAFLFSSTGSLTGVQRLTQEILLDVAGMQFESRVSSQVRDTGGAVIFAGCATSVGRRMD